MEIDVLAPLREEFKARGWNKKATGQIALELAFHVSLALGGIALFIFAHHWALRAFGMAVSTLGSVGVGTNTHTATHYGTSSKRWLNELMAYFGYPFFLQLGLSYWRHQHIIIHHPNPNVMGVDDDADFAPFFASTDREIAAKTGLFHRVFGFQWIFFVLIVWVHGYIRQKGSWTHVIRMLRDPSKRRLSHYLDVAAMLMHYVAWFIVPSFFFPVTHVIGFNILRIGLIGYPLFFVLAPGHYPPAAQVIAKGDWKRDSVLLQTATTINFRTGLGTYGRLLCSGLDLQIEHHLFPGYSHTHYRKMSPFVRAFCEKNGYPYRVMGWAEAVWATLGIFHKPKHVAADFDEFTARVREELAATPQTPQTAP